MTQTTRQHSQRTGIVWAALLLQAALLSQRATADDDVAATPYRPSVSTPAQLSAPGWIEGEFGVQHLKVTDSARRDSLPYTFKYAFSPDWGVRVGGEALVRFNDGQDLQLKGGGDTSIVLKRRFAVDDSRAFGLEIGANWPTATAGLHSGSGKTDLMFNGIYSADLGEWHTDLNLIATHLGQVDEAQSRWQGTWAASLSHPLSEQWGLVGELSGTTQHGAASTAQFLTALSYGLSKRTVFDFGAAADLNHASPHWSAFGGVTLLIGKLN